MVSWDYVLNKLRKEGIRIVEANFSIATRVYFDSLEKFIEATKAFNVNVVMIQRDTTHKMGFWTYRTDQVFFIKDGCAYTFNQIED
jgi:hypothetical protein